MTSSSRERTGSTGRAKADRGTTRSGRGLVGLLLALWLGITLARLMQAEPLRSANDRSRWCTVWALVEEGTYRIDSIRQRPGWDTIDLVRHEGHFYSTKPPLLSTVVAGLYWLEKQTLGWSLRDAPEVTSRILLLVVNVLPMLIALGLFARLVRRQSRLPFTWMFVTTTAFFGTLLFPFTTVLNNHTPAAICVLLLLTSIVPILGEQRWSGWRFALAGLWAAGACCVELPAAALGLVSFGLLLRADRRKTLIWFVPAALIPLGAFFVTNYLATGGWKPFYLDYGTEKYEFIHEGVPSYWMNPRGIDQSQENPLVYLLHCTIGHHGVLSLSPVFLLTLGGWLLKKRWRGSPLQPVHWTGLGLTVLVFGFFLTKTDNYNYGGVSVALRWLLWLVPFWLLAMIPLLDQWAPGRRGQLGCATLLCVSVFSAMSPPTGPWTQPWLFNVMTTWGWIDYSDPPMRSQPAFTSWIRSVPDAAAPEAQTDAWITFQGLDGDGRLTTLRLEDAGRSEVAGRTGRRIRVTQTTEGRTGESLVLTVDAERLATAEDVREMLLWPDGPPDADTQQAAEVFLRGLPAPRAYAPGKLRYVHSSLRPEAFQTRHAASRVLATPKDHPQPTIYRRDVWLTEDVPFGVLEFRVTLQDARSGEVVRQSTMRAVAAGRIAPFDAGSLVFE